jgi:nitrate/TMAO reductase-like tetraheme cytochrome c subunit
MVKKKIVRRYTKSPPIKKEEKVKVKVAERVKATIKAKPPADCPRCKSLKIEVITVARKVAEFHEPSHKPFANSRTQISDSRACRMCGKRWSVAA